MSSDHVTTLSEAISFHQLGDLHSAEQAYLNILQASPRHPDANHNLGMLRVQQGRHGEALGLLNVALEENPSRSQYWISYISTLVSLGEYQIAKDLFDLSAQYGISDIELTSLSRTITSHLSDERDSFGEPTDEQKKQLLELYQSRHLEDAEKLAIDLTESFPGHFFAWKVLGVIYTQQERFDSARQVLFQSLRSAPEEPETHNILGTMLMKMGRFDESLPCFLQAIQLNPQYLEAYNNLGNAQAHLGLYDAAMESFSHAQNLAPQNAELHFNIGSLLHDVGQDYSAISCLQKAIELNPDFAQAHYNLGVVYHHLNQYAAAIASYKKAIAIDQDYADALYNLAISYKASGKLDHAIVEFKKAIAANPNFSGAYNNLGISLHQMGQLDEAAECYRKAIAVEPNSADLYNNLGLVLHDFAGPDEVISCYRRALEINPEYADAYNNLGTTFYELGRHDEAVECYQKALILKPDLPQVNCNMGTVLRDMGRIGEAVSFYLDAISIQPDFENAYHALLFCINYHPDLSGEEIFTYYQKYEQVFARPLRVSWKKHSNQKLTDKRIKVGYIASTLHQHSSRHFLLPLMEQHDKSQVEIYIYSQQFRTDQQTRQYQSVADHWIPIQGMGDQVLCEQIRQDGIDVLVDIPSHTAGNRLQVFARKPAPISLHWLDFGYTTGLKAIDYYLTDWETVPAGSENLFSEAPWRLDVPALVYRAAEGMGEVNALPALGKGYITFGTLTRAVRINHRTIRVWSEILKRVPNSRLVINSSSFQNERMRENLLSQFLSHGIDPERLEIGMSSPPWDVLRGIDIGLDCFPHNSGTTLFETLYMGVPFVTLRDRPSVGRLGSSILKGLGHSEWIADTEDEYVEKAVALAGDWKSLSVLRGRLRDEMQGSALMDEVGFARAVEGAYRQMWKRWCEK